MVDDTIAAAKQKRATRSSGNTGPAEGIGGAPWAPQASVCFLGAFFRPR